MSKLDPKPNRKNKNYSWQDLNHFLQYYFSEIDNDDYVLIDLQDYSMPKEEIINELKQNGYEVSEHGEQKLKIR